MYNREDPKKKAEEEARKTFVFQKKTGSRSKYVPPEKPTLRRGKQSTEERTKEISLCSLELESLTAQSANKQKEIAQVNDLKDYERCAHLHKELRVLSTERHKVQRKLSDLQKKQAKHMNYVARKEKTSRSSPASTATATTTAKSTAATATRN